MNSEHIQKIKSIIHGNWYQLSYIESLEKTKSPYKCEDSLSAVVEMQIDTGVIKDGRQLSIFAPNIHEWGEFIVYFKPGNTPNSFPTNIEDYDNKAYSYELAYEIQRDTALYILKFEENKKLIHSTKYLRVRQYSENALQYMVNKTLFSGNYTAFSSSGDTLALSFENDGRLAGFPKYSSYYVITDFVAQYNENVHDKVCFDIQTENQICYAFKILEDTILLYDYILNYDKGDYEVRELKYRLEKK